MPLAEHGKCNGTRFYFISCILGYRARGCDDFLWLFVAHSHPERDWLAGGSIAWISTWLRHVEFYYIHSLLDGYAHFHIIINLGLRVIHSHFGFDPLSKHHLFRGVITIELEDKDV